LIVFKNNPFKMHHANPRRSTNITVVAKKFNECHSEMSGLHLDDENGDKSKKIRQKFQTWAD
jgi:hypothetical protein